MNARLHGLGCLGAMTCLRCEDERSQSELALTRGKLSSSLTRTSLQPAARRAKGRKLQLR